MHGIVSKRSDDLCCCFAHDPADPSFKIVYRHYATLYFIFLIDEAESELGVLDLLQVFFYADLGVLDLLQVFYHD